MRNGAYSGLEDQNLFLLCKQGDELAFSEIYLRYRGILYRHALKMLSDRDEAQDVIQELFAKLWYKRDSINLNISLSSYLYTAVRNKILDQFAHEKVVVRYEKSLQDFINKGEHTTENLVRERELSAIIEREVSQLPPKMREVFELSRKSHLSYSQISEKLDVSENTVRKHITKALKRLRPRLGYVVWLSAIKLFWELLQKEF